MNITSQNSNNLMDDSNLAMKLEELKQSSNVFLTNLVLDDESCIQIDNFIKLNDIMVNLEGTDGYITSKGLAHLSEAISRSKTLRKLCFVRNQISENDDLFFSTFCKALSINASINELDLSQNMIGKKCCAHLASVIRTNYTLEFINLSKNSIEDEGCTILLNALALNSNIKNLELEGNSIHVDLLQKINSILIQNRNKTERDPNLISTSSSDSNKYQIPRTDFLPNPIPINPFPQVPLLGIVGSSTPMASEIVPGVVNMRNSEIALKYNQLFIDYKLLHEEEIRLRQNLEKERRNVDIIKADFARKIEEEKKIRFNKEEELSKLASVMESNEMKLNQMIGEQRIHFENNLAQFESELSKKNQEIIKLKDLNSKFEKIIEELQSKNDDLSREHLARAEEFQQKLANSNKEYQDSREELVRLLDIGKQQIAKDEADQNKLRTVNEENGRQYDFLLKEFESKMMIERKNLNELMLENKELIDKLHETDTIISECKKEIFNKDQDIINLKKRYDNEVANLKENLMRMEVGDNEKMSDQQLKINHLEDLLNKQKIENNNEKLKIIGDERNKFIKAEDLFNRKYNDLVMKCQDLEKIKMHLEEEIEKLNGLLNEEKMKSDNDTHIMNMAINEQFKNDKALINKQWESKCNQLNDNREEMLRRNNELLNEIENLNTKFSNHSALVVENNALKEDNITLSQALEEYKIQLNRLNKELKEKSDALNKYKINLNSLSIENQKINNDLTIASHTLNDYKKLEDSFNNLEFQYTESKNKAMFFENEYTKAKAYSETLLDQIKNMTIQSDSHLNHPPPNRFISPSHYNNSPTLAHRPGSHFVHNPNFEASPDSSENGIEYAIRPVTKYLKKTVVIPKSGYINYPSHGFKPVPN